ncbi:MAG: hypothetical protein JSW25_08460 [Thermoplasmata archaeon]|nr:MAG: hypothetical protein JSW25_08460 [Thermoplasmata archaeon]
MAKSPEDQEELDLLETRSVPLGIDGLTVEAVTPLYPTEDSTAVGRAILNMFPTMDLEVADGTMTGRAGGPTALARFRRRVREMRIRDTARSQLGRGIDGDAFGFTLNKQSAFASVPNFSTGGAPLGDIDVRVSADDPDTVVEWLCELDED